MHNYLYENHGKRPSINQNERTELDFLRREVASLRVKLQQTSGSSTAVASGQENSESSSDSEGDDVLDLPIEEVKKKAGNRPRASVSAEAYGNWNKKEEFKAPSYPKSEEQTAALKERLSQAFMFSALNPDELGIVLGAMQRVEKKAGDLVIKQGDDGDNLYVVETGTLSCFKTGKVSDIRHF